MNDFLFFYRGFSNRGKKRFGFLFASDLKHLKYITSIRGVRLQTARSFHPWLTFILLYLFRIRKTYRQGLQDRSIFFRQMANLLHSGLTVQKSTEVLIKQERNKYFLRGLCRLHEMLVLGRDLSHSVQEAFSFLPRNYILLLSGCTDAESMSRVFLAISSVSEQKKNLTTSIVRMSVVFIFLFAATIFVFVLYVKMWLFDDRLAFFYRNEMPPPIYESFFQIFSGRAFSSFKYISAFIGIIIAMIVVRSNPGLFLWWKKLVLRIPIIGEGIRTQVASSLFFYLDLQVKGGTTLQKAFEGAVELLSDSPYYLELYKFSDDLKRGRSLDDSLEEMHVFSHDEKALLRTSLSAKSLANTLSVIRDYLDRKMETRILIVRESFRFLLIFGLLILYAWAAYTRLYAITGYGF